MTILATAKLSKGFRVTILKETRDVIGLEESDEIVFLALKDCGIEYASVKAQLNNH